MVVLPLSLVALFALFGIVDAGLGPPMCGYHAEPEIGPSEEPADLTPEKFWNEYVRKAEPVIIRGAVKNDPAITLWNDEYILKNYGDMKVRMESKDEGG